jgi:hypothetical protein
VRRPLRSSLAVLLALGGAAGCTADDGEPAATTSTTFLGVVAKATERKEIVDAYGGHWEPFYRYLNEDADGEPIGNYFAGERRDDLPGQIVEFARKGLEAQGGPDSRIRSVLVDGDRAVVIDCQVDGSFAVDEGSGALVIPPSTVPQLVRAELRRDDSGWKVSSVVYGRDNSCER